MCILSDINFNEFFLYLSPFPKFCSLSRVVKSEHVCLSKQNIVTWNNLNILITVQISTNSKIVFLYVTVPSHLFNFHYINITCPKYIQNVINSKLYKTVIADRSIILGHHAVPCLRITGSLHSTPFTVHCAPRLGCMVTVPYDVLKKQCSSFTAGPRKTEGHQNRPMSYT